MSGDVNGDLRCSFCRSLEWFRDGFVIVEEEDGGLAGGQVEAPLGQGSWSCMSCGDELRNRSVLSDRLDLIRQGHEADPVHR
jgi:hypothetical protein